MEVAQSALVDVASLDELLDSPSAAHEEVGVAQVVNYFAGLAEFRFDASQGFLEQCFNLLLTFFPAVNHDHGHLLVGLNKAVELSLEPGHSLST